MCLIRLDEIADDNVLNSLSVRGYSSVDIVVWVRIHVGMRAFF